MKKICFVLTVSMGVNYMSIFPFPIYRTYNELKEFFSEDYNVSINYLKDKEAVDYLVVPDPCPPFENEENIPIIKVPATLFYQKDYEKMKVYIDKFLTNDI